LFDGESDGREQACGCAPNGYKGEDEEERGDEAVMRPRELGQEIVQQLGSLDNLIRVQGADACADGMSQQAGFWSARMSKSRPAATTPIISNG